jgi:hypothetical protein
MTRTSKTPRQRAEETRDRAKRRVDRAKVRSLKAAADARLADIELSEAKSDLDYANANPALKTEVTAQTGAGAVTTRVGQG